MLHIPDIALGVLALGILQFLLALWVSERLRASLQRETNVLLENLRWDLKVREQAAMVAEYMALARTLTEEHSEQEFREANRLAWELAMWLPAETYRALGKALAAPDAQTNPLTVAIEVRKILLGSAAGDLTADHMIQHAPGIARRLSESKGK